MGPLIEDFYLGESDLDAYYFSYPCSAMAIQFDASYETKRARELEAHGYDLKPPIDGERACFTVDSFDDIDEISVAATKRGLEGNITKFEVRDILEAYIEAEWDDAWWIGLQCRQHVHTVIAVLRYLKSKGELPSKFCWGP